MNIANAWLAGEKTIFDRLVAYTQSKEGWDAFRGWLPEDRSSWMVTTGGGSPSFSIDRIWGDTPLFCTLGFSGRIACRFSNRDECLVFAGKIMAAFNETKNFKQIGNVLWCRITDMPDAPTPLELGEGVIIWLMDIPIDMIVSTNQEF